MLNVRASPMVANSVGNINATIKLNTKLDIVAILIAVPLIAKGIISDINIHAIGPSEKAKLAINVTMLPTATHLVLYP